MPRLLATLLVLIGLAGCGGEERESVTLYTSVDAAYSEPIVAAFEAETGIEVRLVTDAEATKSVGLAERLRAEKDRPVADVFWGNEPFHTVRLAREGLFVSHDWPMAGKVLKQYRDTDGLWIGNGLRARALAIYDPRTNFGPNSSPLPEYDPALQSIRTLASPEGPYKFQLAIARPTAGTTGGHVAALYTLLGEAEADALFRELAGIATVVSGNGPAARAAADAPSNTNIVALTDNDDIAAINRQRQYTLRMILPDQGDGQIGTLTIPTTVALVAKAEPSDAAKMLADFLSSPELEETLVDAGFVLASTRTPVEQGGIRAMAVDYDAVADAMPEAVRRATELLEGREP
jgi:iron(III) transport system substrate-binding protein